MKEFIAKHGSSVNGALSGWDRVVFQGRLRALSYVAGMMLHLSHISVLLKDFGAYAEQMTQRIREASLAAARRLERPVIYLPASSTRKEEVARGVLLRQPVASGLICVLECVEPCMSYEVHRNRQTRKLELQLRPRKCKHLYHYYLHAEFGFLNARLQPWFPFMIQVCINGREWLARQMDKEGLAYDRSDNCFPWIENFTRAQQIMDRLSRVNWPTFLNSIARRLNPAEGRLFGESAPRRHWTAYQTELATDLVFTRAADLTAIYPQLTWGAMTAFQSSDVLRFLGRPGSARFSGEVTGDFKDRHEGVRVKHAANRNSVKMYDKAPNLLRVETTINNPQDLKVYRPLEGDPHGPLKWRKMRKGIADLHRRAQVSMRTNERYLDALAQLDSSLRLEEVFAPLCRRQKRQDKMVRALRPWTVEDQALLEAILRPEFLLAGLRNCDLAKLLYPDHQNTLAQKRRASAKVSYRLRILRAHGLISKLPNQRRYRITEKGRQVSAAAIIVKNVTMSQLTRAAA
jgi:hypothetical protein